MFSNDQNYSSKTTQKSQKIGKNRNKLTSNWQVADMALSLYETEDHLRRAMLKNNLNSYFRDRLVRILTRLNHEAKKLGNDLDQPDPQAFESYEATKQTAKKFGVN
jgi:sugar-specific transcriptional regulator TrmB